jgi:hypothetical protein
MSRSLLRAAVIGLAVAASGAAVAQSNGATRIRGEVVSVAGDTMVVHRTNADNVTVDFKADVPVATLKALKLADIKPGSYVGATSTPGPDGKLVAREVHVFPEAMRGRGDGHRDWDLLPGSSMTNANVDSVAQATAGRELTMSYNGGTKAVVVPETTPVVAFVDGTHADVVAGRKIFITATTIAPGHYAASRVTVEKDGVVPPM